MAEPVKQIDSKVKDELLRFPTMELIKLLYPSLVVKGRSVICSPFRKDNNPSFSCFRDRNGIYRWKDHGEDISGDNIDLFRKVFPELRYFEAVDRLSLMLLGKSAAPDYVPGQSIPMYSQARRLRPVKSEEPEESQKIKVVSDKPYDVKDCPAFLREYVRGRGISDEVASGFFRYVVFENENRKGRPIVDRTSGLPVFEKNGEVLRDDGLFEAVGLVNDLGGFALRAPETERREALKRTNVSFISVIPAVQDEMRQISLKGKGNDFVTSFFYDEAHRRLFINKTQYFEGVEPHAVRTSVVFLDTWIGRYLYGRELRNACAVLSRLSGPMTAEVDVVEGMFDAVSVIEFERMAGRAPRPVRDIVVLNSTGNIQWAIPFLAAHSRVHCLLDNDLGSKAGKKAFVQIQERVADFCGRLGCSCGVVSESSLFYPCKDMNDFLKVRKGFVAESKQAPEVKNNPSREMKPRRLPSSGKKQMKP